MSVKRAASEKRDLGGNEIEGGEKKIEKIESRRVRSLT